MCAIAGLVNLQEPGRQDTDAATVEAMCRLQTHRGPDDCGVASLGRVHLGSNRLSIIDLSSAGHMPMSDERETQWIVYNGELYNFPALRAELEQLGHTFRSHTDTEVVLKALGEWGLNALTRFVGMYAFAHYDCASDTLTLARDRFGKKPLYYTWRDGAFLFASELKTLMAVLPDRRVHERRLIEWSLYRNLDFAGCETLVQGCYQLPPGHSMQIRQGQIQPAECYYAPTHSVDASRYQHWAAQPRQRVVDEMDTLIQASVQDRLISDAPVGTLCSGGLDSSLITALCAQHRPDIQAYHVSVSDSATFNELAYAQQLTEQLGVKLITCELSADSFRRHLPRAIYYSDLPLTHPNSVAYLLVCELARQHGAKVLLTGEAADELFGGYMHRYRRYRQFLRARRLTARLPIKIAQALMLAGYACSGVQGTELEGYGALLPFAINMMDRYARADLRQHCDAAYHFVPEVYERAVLGGMLGDLSNFLAPLLRRLDRMSMEASVECRAPFLDHRLVAMALNLPLSYRLKGRTDKWLLKEVAKRYVPHRIVKRKKMGFPLPLADYLAPLADDALFQHGFCVNELGFSPRGVQEQVASCRTDVQGFYNLLALELWGRLHIYRESLDDLTDWAAKR